MDNYEEFFEEVKQEAFSLGYNLKQVMIFKMDIDDCFNAGKSVEQTVNEVF